MADALTRHQILLFKGDFERLQNIYTSRSATEVIRVLVRQHLRQVEEKLKQREAENV